MSITKNLIVLLLSLTATGIAAAADLNDGKRVYTQVCAACHGETGRPDPEDPVVKALGVQPADLSDPLFNSREPASDWRLVVGHGGHSMGLSAMMPAQKDALSADEVDNVVAYIKTLADTRDYPPGEANHFLPIRTKKAFPEDEVVWKGRYTERDGRDVMRNTLEFEKRVGTRGMVVGEAIFENDGLNSEFSKFEFGYKRALHWDAGKQSILSGAVVVALPTDGGLSDELIPYLAYGRMLDDRWMLQASARAITPFDRASDGKLELAGALHYRWTQWPRRPFAGMEVVAEIPYKDQGGDRVQWSVLPKMRFGLTKGGHVALNLGVEAPLSDQDWNYRIHAVLLWDFADGSFFKGW